MSTSATAAGSRIRAVRAVAVRVPRKPELLPKTAHGETAASEYALLQVETDAGVIGIGEVTTAPRWNGEDAVGSVDLLRRAIGPALLGLAVDDWPAIARAVDGLVRARPFLRAGIEMACLDAAATLSGVPAASMLGTVRVERIPTKIVLPARDPASVAAMARSVVDRGAVRLKVKVGTGLAGDLERVAAVRRVHDGPLSVDANEGWATTSADAIAAAVLEHGLAAVEQPFARDEPTSAAELQARIAIPLVADESVWSIADVRRIAADGSFSAVSLYPGKLGGMRRFVAAAQEADRLGLGVVVGSNLELGIGTAAMAHAAAVLPAGGGGIGHDLIGPWYFEHALVLDAGFVGWDETHLPPGHGLGVEIDREAIERYRLADQPDRAVGGWR